MRYRFPAVVAVFAAGLLAGCAADAPTGPTAGFREVPESRVRLAFDVPMLGGAEPVRVAWRDPLQREEYALFRGAGGAAGAQAEAVFLEALPAAAGGTALDIELVVSEGVRAFTFNAGTAIEWGKSRFVESPFGGTWLQPYSLPERQRACAGFGTAWDVATSDPELRPTKAVFGYVCAAEGESLAPEAAAELVRKVDVIGITRPRGIESAYELADAPAAPLPTAERRTELAVIAQDGAPGSRAGLPAFPLLRARPFHAGAGGAKAHE